jgi:phosphate transport system permease protein
MSTLTASPLKPWVPKLGNLIPEFFGVLITAFATFGIVAITPLKGKLGFAVVLIVMAIIVSGVISWIRRDRRAAQNSTTTVLVYVAAAFVLMPLISILFEIITQGYTGLALNLFTQDMSVTASDSPLTQGGLLHAIIGTLYVVGIATLLSTPIGLLAALYIVEVRGRYAGLARFFIQAMSGIPSIVAGLFIYAIWMINLGNSYSAFAGAVALTILMIPTVARTSEEVLKLIPEDLREAGLALGGTQWRTVAMIVIPAAKSGLITSVILGVARVAGETAPLLLTMGGADAINLNPTDGNNSALPFYVWKYLSLGNEISIQRAWTGVLILMFLVFIFFTATRYFGRARSSK